MVSQHPQKLFNSKLKSLANCSFALIVILTINHSFCRIYYQATVMDLIPYSFAPLILFRVPYTLDLLPYYLSIANGAGGAGIFELLIFQCFV